MSAQPSCIHRSPAVAVVPFVPSAVLFLALCTVARIVDAQARNSLFDLSCTKTWSTAALSSDRTGLAATSISSAGLALFGGGSVNSQGVANVDIFNSKTNQWSTAVLSIGRYYFAATSVQSLALFAGGATASLLTTSVNTVDIYDSDKGTWTTAQLTAPVWGLAATSLPTLALFGGGANAVLQQMSAIVDIYNAASNTWSTAALSVGRYALAATSLPDAGLAIFAGGKTQSAECLNVDIFNSNTNSWTTAVLSVARFSLAATSLPNAGLAIIGGGTVNGGGSSNTVDIYNGTSNSWSTAVLSSGRSSLGASSMPNAGLALFGGGSGSAVVDIFNSTANGWTTAALSVAQSVVATSLQLPNAELVLFAGGATVDIYNVSCIADAPATSAPAPTTTVPATSAPAPATSAFPNATFAPSTSSPLPVPPLLPVPASPIPSYIVAAAAVTSSHFPRALELVQFLALYCTSLSSQQQNHVSQFQVASFTHISSQGEYCKICPGFCLKPSVLLLSTFALMISFCAVGIVVVLFDSYRARKSTVTDSISSGYMQDRLLAAEAASPAGHSYSSMRRKVAVFCVKYFRGLIETASSYLLMPCIFVFVMNAWPSSFAKTDVKDRVMIIALPIVTLLLRSLVIRQRVVNLSSSDQKQLSAGSVGSFANAVIFGVFFNQARHDQQSDDHQSTPSFASATLPQYLVLATLALQLIVQTVIRSRATEVSIFDNTDWPWSSASTKASSVTFTFNDLATRLVVGSIKRNSKAAAIAVLKFILLNYLALSQMTMVVSGLASSAATSWISIETSSVVIGIIPLITSGAMFLYNAVRSIRNLWRCCSTRGSH
jgi:hypothetical protein